MSTYRSGQCCGEPLSHFFLQGRRATHPFAVRAGSSYIRDAVKLRKERLPHPALQSERDFLFMHISLQQLFSNAAETNV